MATYSENPATIISERGVEYTTNVHLLCSLIDSENGLSSARALLEAAGNLQNISHLSIVELMEFPGVGFVIATRIKAALELGRRMFSENIPSRPIVSSPSDSYNYMRPILENREQENLVVLLLNTRNEIIGHRLLYTGSINSISVRIAEVFREAIKNNAAAIILGHNHPSGNPSPSPEDINITKSLVRVGKELDIPILDHIVIGSNGKYVSLRERRLGFD